MLIKYKMNNAHVGISTQLLGSKDNFKLPFGHFKCPILTQYGSNNSAIHFIWVQVTPRPPTSLVSGPSPPNVPNVTPLSYIMFCLPSVSLSFRTVHICDVPIG